MEKNIRTAGDGIDNKTVLPENLETGTVTCDLIKLNKGTYNLILKSMKPVKSNFPLIQLVPKYVPSDKKIPKYFLRKPKDPKFIPYEPYKAATKSFKTNYSTDKSASKSSRNDVEIHNLVSQVVEMRLTEMNKLTPVDNVDESSKFKLQWAKEKQTFENDIRNLKETNSHLENQLKFQAQVCI